MKIALINLPSSFLIDDKVFPPLGILYIASKLRELGHEISWHDLAGKTEEKLKNYYVNEKFVFITLTSPQIPIAKIFVENLLKKDKKYIVVGGCGVDSLNENFPCNIATKGQGENIIKTVLDLLKFSQNKNFELSYIVEGNSVDINSGLIPARDLIKDYNYFIKDKLTTTMISSRGCCYECIYCVDGNKNKLQLLSVINAYKEINQISKLGWKAIMFFDDIFTLKLDRLRQITYYLKHINMNYRCFTHVNFVNEKLCEILKETNCHEVGIGIESGSNKILKTIKKGFEFEKGVKAIKLLRSHNIRVKAFFMVGLPGENIKTIEETKKFIEQSEPDDMDFSIYVPFPNTTLHNNKNQYDISWDKTQLTHFKGKFNSYKTSVSTSQLTSEQILIERNKLEKYFKKGEKK